MSGGADVAAQVNSRAVTSRPAWMNSPVRVFTIAAIAATAAFPAAHGQQPTEPPPASGSQPRPPAPPGAQAAPKPKADAAEKVDSLEVTEKRTPASERRDSTASKIVVGREEIEQYGDTNLGDVLRRLPGVTQAGRPGRFGAIRLRGMAGGYTQVLVNGERIPPGYSIEEIEPDQVERIEILRAPTAETGTRAVAGTINIVLREALAHRNNEAKAGTQLENGRYTTNASVTRNDALSEAGTYNVTLSASHRDQDNDGRTGTTYVDVPTDTVTLAQRTRIASTAKSDNLFLTSRFQWRLGPGEQFGFQPFVVAHDYRSASSGRLVQDVGASPAPYDSSASGYESRFRAARFMTNLSRRLDPLTTLELRGGAGTFTVKGDSRLDQFDASGFPRLRQTTVTDVTDRRWNATAKLARSWGEAHKATAGAEWEETRRREAPQTILDGEVQLADYGSEFNVAVRRAAGFLQDEWDPNPRWATSLGLRWESIETRSEVAGDPVSNRSNVLNPLAHVVWRFDAPRRDQVRASLTQSYRAPTTQDLVARPRLNALYPVPGPNTATSADAAGNPALKPEVANGLEIAYERYLPANGVLSANVFTRRLQDVIRNVTILETVSWAGVQRWVTRPQNLGHARTAGLELDARFRADELVAGAPRVNVHANFAIFRSRVDQVPGPDNRLASQPDMTGNVGADYRFPGTPLSLGGSVNWTPAYDTRLTAEQVDRQRRKVIYDAYALWNLSAGTRIRFSVTAADPRDYQSTSIYLVGDERQSLVDTRTGHVVTALRLEMRL